MQAIKRIDFWLPKCMIARFISIYLDEEIFVFVEPHRLDEVVSLEVDDRVWLKG